MHEKKPYGCENKTTLLKPETFSLGIRKDWVKLWIVLSSGTPPVSSISINIPLLEHRIHFALLKEWKNMFGRKKWGVNKWRQKMRTFVQPLRITMLLKYPCNVRKLAVSRFAAIKSHKTSTWFEAVLLKGSSCSSWPGFWTVFGKKNPTKQQNSPHVQGVGICREHQESLRELNRAWRMKHTSSKEAVVSAQGPSLNLLSYFLCAASTRFWSSQR